MEQGVELRDVISQLRADLSEAMADGAGRVLQFEAGVIELEVTIAVQKSAQAGVKARFWVVDSSVDGQWAATNTQRLKLTLTPRLLGAPGDPALISGHELQGEH